MGADNINPVSTDDHFFPGIGQHPGLGRSHQSGLTHSAIIELMRSPDLQRWNQNHPFPDNQLFCCFVQCTLGRTDTVTAACVSEMPGTNISLAGDQYHPAHWTAALTSLAPTNLLD